MPSEPGPASVPRRASVGRQLPSPVVVDVVAVAVADAVVAVEANQVC